MFEARHQSTVPSTDTDLNTHSFSDASTPVFSKPQHNYLCLLGRTIFSLGALEVFHRELPPLRNSVLGTILDGLPPSFYGDSNCKEFSVQIGLDTLNFSIESGIEKAKTIFESHRNTAAFPYKELETLTGGMALGINVLGVKSSSLLSKTIEIRSNGETVAVAEGCCLANAMKKGLQDLIKSEVPLQRFAKGPHALYDTDIVEALESAFNYQFSSPLFLPALLFPNSTYDKIVAERVEYFGDRLALLFALDAVPFESFSMSDMSRILGKITNQYFFRLPFTRECSLILGENSPRKLSRIYEMLLGAIYLDSNLETAHNFYVRTQRDAPGWTSRKSMIYE